MKAFAILWVVAACMVATMSFADMDILSKLPEEPALPDILTDTGGPEDTYKKVYFNTLLGLFYIEFDLDGDGTVDYITAHRIILVDQYIEERKMHDQKVPRDKFAELESPIIENY